MIDSQGDTLPSYAYYPIYALYLPLMVVIPRLPFLNWYAPAWEPRLLIRGCGERRRTASNYIPHSQQEVHMKVRRPAVFPRAEEVCRSTVTAPRLPLRHQREHLQLKASYDFLY